MKIIAGTYRSTPLTPVGKGDIAAHLRPTPQRVRENLFNILANRLDFDGIRVLDLFCGTGALGLEAISRGARHTTFVDNGRAALKLIEQNISRLGLERDRDAAILASSATALPGAPGAVDLVFLDPPYGGELGGPALRSACEKGWIAPPTLIVWEDEKYCSLSGFDVLDTRSYAKTCLTFLSLAKSGIE